MASTRRSRSSSASSDSSDMTMLDAPTHAALTPARPRQPSLSTTQSAPSTQPSTQPSLSTTQGAHSTQPSQPAPPPANPAFSLLLSLPRELRDRVYTFALSSPYPFWWPSQALMRHNVAAPLLQASRQLHDEAAPVLYTANKFLFTHPSDCNIFRVVASPHATAVHSVYFRIREKDLRLWTAYLGSKTADRSLKADLPSLKTLCIFMRCASVGAPRLLGHLGLQGFGGVGLLPPPMAMHVQAVQNALGHQVAALQQQVHHFAHAVGVTGPPVIVPAGAHPGHHHPPNPPQPPVGAGAATDADPDTATQHHAPPPPPPPPPAVPFAAFAAGAVPHHHPHPPAPAAAPGQPNHSILTTFLRFERELGIESLCLSLRETLQDRPTTPAAPDARSGHRERRREDRDLSTRTSPSHRETRERERERDRRSEKTEDTPPPRRHIPDVKIVCILRAPKHDVSRLVRLYPEELTVDRNGDARTRFRRLHGADVCVEISGFEGVVG
ncbi:hypothetical protein M3J09_007858 [Ascochyta lentis]